MPISTIDQTGLNAPLTLTSPTLTSPTMTGAVVSSMASSVITSGTSQSSTSGTSITFSSLPSWIKRITVMFNSVSTSGTSNIQVQIGSGSVTATGYQSAIYQYSGANASSTTGFLATASITAAGSHSGSMMLTLLSGNLWSEMCGMAVAGNSGAAGGGVSSALSGTLDRVVITTVNGTDTFDNGSINIIYE